MELGVTVSDELLTNGPFTASFRHLSLEGLAQPLE